MSHAFTVPIPRTREPFVNTPLLSLGPGEDGSERFWIATYNRMNGATGVLVTEDGRHRLFRFGARHAGFESACQEDADTLWLCGNLSCIIRLHLPSGDFEEFSTGGPNCGIFKGMAFDPRTRKLFAAGSMAGKAYAFSFDTKRRVAARCFEKISVSRNMCGSFPNGDGSWSIVMALPGASVLVWDPRRDSVREHVIAKPGGPRPGFVGAPVRDGRGRVYFSRLGWYDPDSRRITPQRPAPRRETSWFARREDTAWGADVRDEDVEVLRWRMKTGEVDVLCRIPDCQHHNVNLTASGKVVAVNMFGVFHRFDARTGGLECARPLPVTGMGQIDCLCRIDKRRLLGTPYISQRFWQLDLKTGKGVDLGRAAPRAGEILQTARLNRKVYMAAYYGGELVEYDPERPVSFPENPRVVASPPDGMRPVALAHDGRVIHYACNKHYGGLGAVLTRYDTRTAQATWADDPLGRRQVLSLWRAPRTDSLYAGSAVHGDTYSCSPAETTALFGRFDAGSLKLREAVEAPRGVTRAHIAGPLDAGRFLVVTQTDAGERRWGALAMNPLAAPEAGALRELPVACPPIYAGKPGFFVYVVARKRVELWDMRRERRVRVVFRIPRAWPLSYRCVIEDNALHLAFPRRILVVEGLL